MALLATSLLASLAGSLHCAGMCGPLMVLLHGPGHASARVGYHLGRILTYALLGLTAGLVGHGIDSWGTAAGLTQGALILGAAGLLLSLVAPRISRSAHSPKRLQVLRGALRQANPAVRGLLFGGATGLMPCGWLYAWLALAAASGSALSGATVMTAFAVGSVPALAMSGLVLARLRIVLGARSRLAPIVLMTVAAIAIMVRSSVFDDLRHALTGHSATVVCHGG
jgi:sulfite exporter TauE/SafE